MFRKKPQPPIEVNWIIVGLGNPGAQYDGTRHNVGFEVIDRLCHLHKIKFDKSKHRARYGVGTIAGEGVVLVKPMTFMNLSGQAVAPIMREHGLKPERVLIVADDTDLQLGRIRIRSQGSAGGHNGHKSIIASLGTTEYPRVKMGIGRVEKDDTIDHVLGKFTFQELVDARQMVERSAEAVELILADGLVKAMATINPAKGD